MDGKLTLMAVHAHPDDEVIGTGGLLARCAEEGIRTVLVTCTNGEQGDGPGGVKPGEPGHDPGDVRTRRLVELRESAGLLGIEHVELLGYRDSGMVGWDTNDHPEAFANVPVDQGAAKLLELIERYRPQVLVTYGEDGGYGHPDHVQAHRITIAAVEKSEIPRKLYYTAVPKSRFEQLFALMVEAGMDPAELDVPDDIGTPDEEITAVLDTARYADRKRKAMAAHASQGDSTFFLGLPEEAQRSIYSEESFVRHLTRVEAPDHENDLFTGLR